MMFNPLNVSNEELEEVNLQVINQVQMPLDQVLARRVTYPCPPVLPLPHAFHPYDVPSTASRFMTPSYEYFYYVIANILETLSLECVYPIFITHGDCYATMYIYSPQDNYVKSDDVWDIRPFLEEFAPINPNAYDPNFDPEIDNYGPRGHCIFLVSIYRGDIPGTFMCHPRQVHGPRNFSIIRAFHARLDDRLSDMTIV